MTLPRHSPSDRLVGRDNIFNALRLLLASLVILSHAPQLMDGNATRELLVRFTNGHADFGSLAVDCFFIISGFLIAHSWFGSSGFLDFLKKRILRIYPGFVAAFLFSVFLIGIAGTTDGSAYLHGLTVKRTVFDVVTLGPPRTPIVFHPAPYPFVNGALWTIRYEFLCYLGLAALGITGLLRRRAFTVGVFLVFLCAHVAINWSGVPVQLHFRFWPEVIGTPSVWVRLGTFYLSGTLLYLYRTQLRFSRRLAIVAAIATFVGAFLLPGYSMVFPTLGAYTLFAVALAPVPILWRVGDPDFSYGVYLYGWPAQKVVVALMGLSASPWLIFVLSMVAVMPCAALSWYLIERPFLRLKNRSSVSPPAKQNTEPLVATSQ